MSSYDGRFPLAHSSIDLRHIFPCGEMAPTPAGRVGCPIAAAGDTLDAAEPTVFVMLSLS